MTLHAITVLEHASTIGAAAKDVLCLHLSIGDFCVSRGEAATPLEAYRAACELALILSSAEPENDWEGVGSQRDLFVSHNKVCVAKIDRVKNSEIAISD